MPAKKQEEQGRCLLSQKSGANSDLIVISINSDGNDIKWDGEEKKMPTVP